MCWIRGVKCLLFMVISALVFIARHDVFALTIHPVTSPTNTNQQLISGTVDAGEIEVVVTLDTAAGNGIAVIADGLWNYLVTGLAEGVNTVTVTATNAEQIQTGSVTATLVLDTVAPETSLIETPTNPSNARTGFFSFGSADTGASFECELNGSPYELCSSPYSFSLGDGNHTFRVRAKDAAGNVETTPAEYNWTIDTVAPGLTSASFVDSTHVDVSFSETVLGADSAANFAINNGLVVIRVDVLGSTTYRLTTGVQTVDMLYEITAANITDSAGNPLGGSASTAVFSRPLASNGAPAMPVLNSPPSATEVQGSGALTPALVVNASTDPDGDPITYTFELSAVRDFSEPVVSPKITATGATATWVVESPLVDNAVYYWRAFANDGYLNSNETSIASFFVNTANDPPADPAVSSPANGTEVGTRTPEIAVTNSSDVDNDTLTYECDLATDGAFASIVASTTGIAQGTTGTTAWTVPAGLNDNAHYFWRCRARDEHGATSGNWASAGFYVNTENDSPTVPAVNAPANGSEVTILTPALTVNNASDIDLFTGTLGYIFEIDTVNNFNSADKQTSPLISEGAGSTSWTPATLIDNRTWYWHAKANDGKADGPWTAPASFFVNQFNDAPSVPTVANPNNNGQVTSLTPQLSLNPATDPDNDRLTYEFAVYSDAGRSPESLVANGSDQRQTAWTVTPPLSDNIRYYWVARAKDEHGANSRWSDVSSFIVKNSGDGNAPPTITVTAPGLSEPVTNGTSFTIRWDAADPDSAAYITLFYDTGTTGDTTSRTQIVTGISKDDPAKSYSWDTSSLADGAYYVYAEIEDGKSKATAYSSGPLIIDRTPPVALISGAPPASTNATGATLTVGGTDVAGYRYRIDSGTYSDETPPATPLTVAALADGTHTVSVVGRDNIGNWQQNPTTVSWTVDTIPPAAVISGAPAAQTRDVSATMTVGGIGVVSYRYSLDSGPYSSELSSSTPIRLESLAAGAHTVAVVGKDLAGNWQAESNPATAIWIIDLEAPTAKFASVPDPFSNNASPVLTVGGIGVVAYRYRLDNGPFSDEIPVSSPISLQNLQEGAHSVAIVGKDGAGNWQAEGSPTTAAWIVDTIAPVFLELSLLPDGSPTNEPVQNVAGTVSDLNLNELMAQVSAGGSLGNSAITVGGDGSFSHLLELQPGDNFITITAVDNAGNVTTDTRKIIVDRNSPAILITTPADNSTTNQSTVNIRFTTGETVPPTVDIKLNDVTLPVAADGDVFSAKAEKLVTGINTITITVTDPAGNVSTAKRTVTFDNTAPSLNITSPAQDLRTNVNPFLIKGTFSDGLSGVAITLSMDGKEIGPPTIDNGTFEQKVEFVPRQNKRYRITVTAMDEAGNKTSILRNIDFAAPAKGDLNGSGATNIQDALIALRIVAGLDKVTDNDIIYGDVAPLVNGTSNPDGKLDLGDVVVILRVAVGLIEL